MSAGQSKISMNQRGIWVAFSFSSVFFFEYVDHNCFMVMYACWCVFVCFQLEIETGGDEKESTNSPGGGSPPKLERQWSAMLEDVRKRSSQTVWFRHLWAMLYKKFSYARRDRRVLLCQLFCPLLFIFFSCSFSLIVANNPVPRFDLSTTAPYGGPSGYDIPYNGLDASAAAVWVNSYGSLSTQFGRLQSLAVGGNNITLTQEALLNVASQTPLNYYAFFMTGNKSVYDPANQSMIQPNWFLGLCACWFADVERELGFFFLNVVRFVFMMSLRFGFCFSGDRSGLTDKADNESMCLFDKSNFFFLCGSWKVPFAVRVVSLF